jgi:chromosome segregation and condensation protein ScpB
MAVAYFQPVTRGELSETFGREISRDLIAALRAEGLIAAGPRSPTLGAPHAYVTTEKFLLEFGFESLRDLPDLEALKDAGLMPADPAALAGAEEAEAEGVPDGLPRREVSRDRVA